MIKEKLLSVFATCMALSVVSLVYAQETPLYDYVKPNDEAPCIEALVVVRHAEDNDPKSSEKHELTTGGKAHAQAYKELVGLLTRMLGICPVYYFVSSDRGSENPYMTVKPSADYYGYFYNNQVVSDFTHTDPNTGQSKTDKLDINFNWSNPDFLSSLIKPGQSTFMALSKEIMGHGGDDGLALSSFTNKKHNREYIRLTAGEMPFNHVYIFTKQNQDNKKFDQVSMYLQLYAHKVNSPGYKKDSPETGYFGGPADAKSHCNFRINPDRPLVTITDLEVLTHNDSYITLTHRWGCQYDDQNK